MAFTKSTAVNIATIFEDCANQLFAMGTSLPVPLSERSNLSTSQMAFSVKVGADESNLVHQSNIESLEPSSETVHIQPEDIHLWKVQIDVQFCENLLYDVCIELSDTRTYSVLLDALDEDSRKKEELKEAIYKEEYGHQKIKQLEQKILAIRKGKKQEILDKNCMIARLNDFIQEMKVKTKMEAVYLEKLTASKVHQNQKKLQIAEQKHIVQMENISIDLDTEHLAHFELQHFFKKQQKLRKEDMEYWMNKYDADMEEMLTKLNDLKTSKNNNFARLQEQSLKYINCEEIVMEERNKKENERREKMEKELLLTSVICIQTWWRGLLVVKCLGPFDKKKMKNTKKGSKKSKKKSKKKEN